MDRITGLLLGTAVGDSLGLPREGLSPRRARRLYPGPLRQRLGLLSDDTEHACMTAQALLAEPNDPRRFGRVLARKLRWWLAALPPAIGFGTLRALAFRRAVWSAGNGAVMRAPVIGAVLDDVDRIEPFVAASTAITHRDPRALAGALAIAIAAHHAARDRADAVLDAIRARVVDRELLAALDRVEAMLDRPSIELAHELGLSRGITGYVHHTVPMCLHAWLRAPHEFARPVAEIIELGGDSDTTGAIVGALAGASAGEGAIPREWLAIRDAPRSLAWIRKLARSTAPIRIAWPLIPLRNLAFAAIVIAVGLRRLLPPY
ncbi:MAG TPA: ADP-ribosylglycohydrolase family protein [Kofleriaceae bacterium]|jgi:ADP-ribosylglycohydrolase